jgi:hypothetical protein
MNQNELKKWLESASGMSFKEWISSGPRKSARIAEPICSDWDEDCRRIKDPFMCWLGGSRLFLHLNETYTTPVADGFCPLSVNTIEAYKP